METAGREANLVAVRDDIEQVMGRINNVVDAIEKIEAHLYGDRPVEATNKAELTSPDPCGWLPIMCQRGSMNIGKLEDVAERLTKIGCQLGVDW